MTIKLVECLSWPAANKPGKLLQVAEHLKKERVDLEALFAYSTADGHRIAAVAKSAPRLHAALAKAGIAPEASHCFYITGADKAGALVETLAKLAKADVNIECADAVAAGGKFGATLWVGSNDLARAKKALKVR